MEREQNTQYLLKKWTLSIILLPFLGLVFAGLLWKGEYLTVIIFLVTVGAGLGWASFNYRQAGRLLQETSPQPLIDWYEKAFSKTKMADREAFLASSKALVYTLFGRFELARLETREITWEQQAPMVQASQFLLEALWAYLEKHDFQKGLGLAQTARKMADVSTAFPFAGVSIKGYEALVEIGEVLTGTPSLQTVSSLEAKLNQVSPYMKIVVAWGLESFYNRSGQSERAEHMRSLINRLGPYCYGVKPLT
ncbi:MAG: hypothetical protein K1Y36_27960 [Blastocatellia bacterium]|nr:hypothetical protein [Blastocatellia bacterium]